MWYLQLFIKVNSQVRRGLPVFFKLCKKFKSVEYLGIHAGSC